MSARRWDLVVAGMELACGIGVAAYFVALGLSADGAPDRSALDCALPFLLAAVGLAVLGTMAWRSVRRARAAPAPAHDRSGFPGVECKRGRSAGTPRAPSPPDDVTPPALSEHGRAELARIVAVLGRAGILAPRLPELADLQESVADAGEPVTPGTVLGALQEAEYWHPGVDADEHLAALAFHDSHGEQLADTVAGQVDDLARLVGDALTVRLEHLEIGERHRIGLRLGEESHDLDYPGAAKYLSTVVHVAVARAARARGRRLAWLWVDEGVWITALHGGTTVEALNAELAGSEPWEWVDEQPPTAAGEP
ncbi:hypothetical protein [Actinomycetospora sp. CA-053990]|uniref:hypothetical protein n=1 Tax=Actinomycetospora sp. CA-053990 TaxID=3239891 RepID=UPI003D8FEFF9